MAKTVSSNPKLNRHSDMDHALFEALASSVPHKNTGPDPEDILGDDLDDDIEASNKQGTENRELVLALDDIDRARARQIMELVRDQSGEQIDMAGAIQIALSLCSMDEQEIGTAYRGITTRKHRD